MCFLSLITNALLKCFFFKCILANLKVYCVYVGGGVINMNGLEVFLLTVLLLKYAMHFFFSLISAHDICFLAFAFCFEWSISGNLCGLDLYHQYQTIGLGIFLKSHDLIQIDSCHYSITSILAYFLIEFRFNIKLLNFIYLFELKLKWNFFKRNFKIKCSTGSFTEGDLKQWLKTICLCKISLVRYLHVQTLSTLTVTARCV